jgi:hypothetical protein
VTSNLEQGREAASLRTSVAAGRKWLFQGDNDDLGRDLRDNGFRSALEVLVALWICDQVLLGRASPEIHRHARRISAIMANRKGEIVRVLLRCDAALVVVACGILRAVDSRSDVLEEFCREIADGLRLAEQRRDAATEAPVYLTMILLHSLGHLPDPGSFRLEPAREGPPDRPLQQLLADDPTIQQHLDSISALTQLGDRPAPNPGPTLGLVPTLLPIWMSHSFRTFKLDLGASILRAILYLEDADPRVIRNGTGAILGHQQSDGEFSCPPGLEEPIGVRRKPSIGTQLLCLWTLAECLNPGFRLARSVRV